VLWHEFCHVVTLQKTNNKMPRWLSEGISVYEELQRDAAWGDTLSAEYRVMILGADLTPVSQLSSAFLNPKSSNHLQFAYYESALVVEYLIAKYGQETLLRILIDLSVGIPVNESLQRYTGSLAALDAEFSDWIRDPPSPAEQAMTPAQALAWWNAHPNNYFALQMAAKLFISREEWDAAIPPLEQLIDHFPQERGSNSALRLLARVYRETGDEEQELKLLRQVVREQGNALDEVSRLIELEAEAKDWEGLAETARRGLAINPLRPVVQQALADAADHLNRPTDAIAAYRALLQLDPIDPAGMHYELAEQYVNLGKRKLGKRQVLLALEQAPRYRQALALLKQLADEEVFPPNPSLPNPVPPNPAPPNTTGGSRPAEDLLSDRKESR